MVILLIFRMFKTPQNVQIYIYICIHLRISKLYMHVYFNVFFCNANSKNGDTCQPLSISNICTYFDLRITFILRPMCTFREQKNSWLQAHRTLWAVELDSLSRLKLHQGFQTVHHSKQEMVSHECWKSPWNSELRWQQLSRQKNSKWQHETDC